jgi:hypothetical protein
MGMGEGTITTAGCKLLLDAFQLIGTSRRNGIPDNKGVFKLGSI